MGSNSFKTPADDGRDAAACFLLPVKDLSASQPLNLPLLLMQTWLFYQQVRRDANEPQRKQQRREQRKDVPTQNSLISDGGRQAEISPCQREGSLGMMSLDNIVHNTRWYKLAVREKTRELLFIGGRERKGSGGGQRKQVMATLLHFYGFDV